MGVVWDKIIKRYKIEIVELTEAGAELAINNIVDGVLALNKPSRTEISGYTRPSTLISGKFVSSNILLNEETNGKWKITIIIEIKWCTS